ncbi:MAG: hypothetical protein U1F77_07050 [Kiritimatiellia bacterium]
MANRTSWDAVFGEGRADPIRGCPRRRASGRAAWWYSSAGNYCQPASSYTDEWNNNVAQSPDRGDFGKWPDAAELFYGRYALAGLPRPADSGNYLNEGDWFDFLNMTPGVIELWRYMGYYPEFWIRKTGHPGDSDRRRTTAASTPSVRLRPGPAAAVRRSMRSTARHRKWNTVFMAESLDGGVVGCRSNRHFDILNENFVFTSARRT